MTSAIPIAIHGASGRMGQALLQAARERADAVVVAAMVSAGSPWNGQRVEGGELVYSAALDAQTRVLVDFSHAGAFDDALRLAIEQRIGFVSGTTGIDARQREAMESAAATIPVLWSANFSLGIALLTKLVEQAARALPQWDCEIVEAHHDRKRDAPSGTALALGRAVAVARDMDFDTIARRSRDAESAPRVPGEIGFAVIRAGDIVGEHEVVFATRGERIELAHRATDRAIFARGAIEAACWIAGKPTGLYALADVFEQGR